MEVVVLSTQELNNRGVALCAIGDYDRGLLLLRKAQSSDTGDPDLCCSLANALSEHGDYEEALYYLRHALEIEPDHLPAAALIENVQSEIRERNRPPHIPYKPPMVPPDTPTRQTLRVVDPYVKSVVPTPWQPYRVPWLTVAVFFFLAVSCGYALWLVVHPPDFFPTGQAPVVYPYSIEKVEDDTPMNRLAMIDNSGNSKDTTILPTKVDANTRIFQYNCVNTEKISVGVITINGLIRGFILDNGDPTFLNPLPSDTASCAESINDSDVVVGYSGITQPRAVCWDGIKAMDLNAEIPGGSFLTLTDGLSVDDAGKVVVSAVDNHGAKKIAELVPN